MTGWQEKSGMMTGLAASNETSMLLQRRASHELYQEKKELDSRRSRTRTNKSIG